MKTDPQAAHKFLIYARQSLHAGNRSAARRWAEQAVAQNPGLEEAWLIFASIAHSRASVAYYEKALQINPQSAQARKGLHESIALLRKEQITQQYIKPDKNIISKPSRPVFLHARGEQKTKGEFSEIQRTCNPAKQPSK